MKKHNLSEHKKPMIILGILMLFSVFAIGLSSAAAWPNSLNNSLVNYYKLDENTGLISTDNAGNNTLILSSTNLWQGGNQSYAIGNNATSNSANSTYKLGAGVTGFGYSISFYVYYTGVAPEDYQVLITNARGATSTCEFAFTTYGQNITNILFNDNVVSTAANNVSYRKWDSYVLTYSGTGNMQVYRNGVWTMNSSGNNNNCGLQNSTEELILFRPADSGYAGAKEVIIDEVGIWNRSLNSTEISQLASGITHGGISGLNPTVSINLINPIDDSTIVTNGENFTVNSSITGEATNWNFTNITWTIWYNNGTTFNQTVRTGLTSNSSDNTQFIDSFILGNYYWNAKVCYANATFSNCTWGDSGNYSFGYYPFSVNSETYNNQTIMGSYESFKINITTIGDYQVSTLKLVYNGTQYPATFSLSSGYVIGSANIIIPQISSSSNLTFYWNISFSGAPSFLSTEHNQSVYNLSIDDCSVNSFILYNFTLVDERTQLNLTSKTNTNIEINLVLYNLLRTSVSANYSQKFTDINPAKLCSNINLSSNYSADAVVKYYSEGNSSSSVEYYNLINYTIGPQRNYNNVTLYALNSTEGTDFQLTFRDKYLALAPDVLFYIQREYVSEGVFKIVEIPKTDSNGQAILHLVRNDVRYNFLALDSEGNIIATFNNVVAFCQDYTIGSCTLNLNARSESDEAYDYLEDVSVSYSISYSNATKIISLAFVSRDMTTKTVSMNAIRNNDFGNRTVCSDTLVSLGGTLSCNASSVSNTDKYLFIEIYINGELKAIETINLDADSFSFGNAGYFIAFLIILFVITLFIEDKQGLIIALAAGWLVVISFGLVKGKIFGLASGGVWLVICLIIFVWKLKKEENG